MKKSLMLLIAMTIIPNASFAFVEPQEVADLDSLRIQGYSESALRVVDRARYAQESYEGGYVRYFAPKKPKNNLGKAYTALKLYVDPIQDDNLFAEHQINYTNTWTGENQGFSVTTERRKQISDL